MIAVVGNAVCFVLVGNAVEGGKQDTPQNHAHRKEPPKEAGIENRKEHQKEHCRDAVDKNTTQEKRAVGHFGVLLRGTHQTLSHCPGHAIATEA